MIASDRASIFFAKNPRKSTDYSRLLTSILSKQRLKKKYSNWRTSSGQHLIEGHYFMVGHAVRWCRSQLNCAYPPEPSYYILLVRNHTNE